MTSSEAPFYLPVGNEVEIFTAAFTGGLAIMLKGPTGTGKTRFVEHMAHTLGVGVNTVSCHEDITSGDLLGRFVLKGGETIWTDGPMTRSAREGSICYLDEIVEARQDSIVAIHSLADHRRELSLERLGGERLVAADGFGLVVSFNPGYQSVLKDLKMSTRQRMVAIDFSFPEADIEMQIVKHESGAPDDVVSDLVTLGQAVRRLDSNLREVSSTRTLVAAAVLVANGLDPREAAMAAIAGPLSDDPSLIDGLRSMVETYVSAD